MKKLLLLIFSAYSILATGQSLEIVAADTVVAGDANTSSEVVAYITVKNISGSQKLVRAKRIDKNYNALTDSNAICWADQCYVPWVSVSPLLDTLDPNEESIPFSGHVYPDRDGVSRSGSIRYVFYDDQNPSDSVSHTITYEVSNPMGTEEVPAAEALKVFPNPATEHLTVNYNLTGRGAASMELVNMVGQRVYQRALTGTKGEFKLDLSKLNRGVYFYILRSGGESVLTRKLIVE